MASFGKRSRKRLSTCHGDLVTLMGRVVSIRDCAIVCGVRTAKDQMKAFDAGKSQVPWPYSKHNVTEKRCLSAACDIVPWPEQYTDTPTMIYLAGVVMATAEIMRLEGEIEHKIRWGGDWNRGGDLTDESFRDMWHFELID